MNTFDPDAVVAIADAYDLACQTLQNIGELEVDREIIARGILLGAETGKRDANKLCELAILGLTAVDYRQHQA
jgi:crotonobetainyl-CoA:carnitine CoA-transferase CaiB-like acyl-CoA transferase